MYSTVGGNGGCGEGKPTGLEEKEKGTLCLWPVCT